MDQHYPDSFKSKVTYVQILLEGIQLVAAAEAIALASNVGLDAEQLYNIICGAAGNSKMFETRVLRMLELDNKDSAPKKTLQETIQELDNTLKLARYHKLATPLASTALQLLTFARSNLQGHEDDSSVFKIWNAKKFEVSESQEHIRQRFALKPFPTNIAFIGLGTMGKGMATTLMKIESFNVVGYDNYTPCAQSFAEQGGKVARCASEAVSNKHVIIFMTVSLEQAESVLLDPAVINEIRMEACIVLCLTAPPSGIKRLKQKLDEVRPDLDLVDAPVSGGEARAANGTLTITASSSPGNICKTGLELALPILQIMAASDGKIGQRLFLYPERLGHGNRIKMINQLLAGIHITAGAEAIAFSKALGMTDGELVRVHQCLVEKGSGFMFNNRMGRVVRKDPAVESKMEIFYKDLSIVVNEASNVMTPVPLASLALTKFTEAMARGWAKDDDGSVIRLWNEFPLPHLTT